MYTLDIFFNNVLKGQYTPAEKTKEIACSVHNRRLFLQMSSVYNAPTDVRSKVTNAVVPRHFPRNATRSPLSSKNANFKCVCICSV